MGRFTIKKTHPVPTENISVTNARFFAEKICVQTWSPLRGTCGKQTLRRNAFFSYYFGFTQQISIPPMFHANSLHTQMFVK